MVSATWAQLPGVMLEAESTAKPKTPAARRYTVAFASVSRGAAGAVGRGRSALVASGRVIPYLDSNGHIQILAAAPLKF